MKLIIVIYHKDCLDGFSAAWAAWKKFGSKAEYISLEPRGLKVPQFKNREIYFLDVCATEKTVKILVEKNKKVAIIDHHISRKDVLKHATISIFSLSNSAAVLSWRYFHPQESVPKLLKFIEDYDLWRFRFSGTKEFIEAVKMRDFNFNLWNKMVSDFELPSKRKKYFEEGRIIVKASQKLIQYLVAMSPEVVFENKRAIAVNSPILESEIGHYIYEKKKYPVGIVWSQQNGMIKVGLRSGRNIDVSKIAQKYGGGGHKQAAGFRLKIGQAFPWKIKNA